MQVRAQLMMVMNLDKCLGCHTCSVTCKQVWTNRDGAEYIWFNNVETRPGAGYPSAWQDQERYQGGWKLDRRGRLTLRAGGRLKKLITIFGNFDMPLIDDYYEPWTYDYEALIDTGPGLPDGHGRVTGEPGSPAAADGSAPAPHSSDRTSGIAPPVITPRSSLTGEPMQLEWGPNWEDNLAGVLDTGDAAISGLEERVTLSYERLFLFYLPRICNHCLNPSCVASCPSGALYKREADGVVLVDQDKCRGWRFCVSGCPYKKVYFNHASGKAEKCIFCYPLTENGRPTVCSETCVGRLRSVGVVLYDLEAVTAAAETPAPADLVEAQRGLLLDPHDPRVRAAAERDGVPHEWIEAARRSPVYALAKELRVALPLRPEYRTVPMVWYVPPLSPVLDTLAADGYSADDPDTLFPLVRDMRIPQRYLAAFLAAGNTAAVDESLRRLLAMRTFKRSERVGGSTGVRLRHSIAEAHIDVGAYDLERMYRLLALAAYDERYVVPKARRESAGVSQTQYHSKSRRRQW